MLVANYHFVYIFAAKIQHFFEIHTNRGGFLYFHKACYWILLGEWRIIPYLCAKFLKNVDYDKETFDNSNDEFCDDDDPSTDLWLR